ncbi:MAG: hypothetical protein ACI3XG_02220 [Faecousia sp.]
MQEFAMNAVNALHLNALEQYVPDLGIWMLYFCAVLGLLCCFFGWKLRNLWFAAVCLVFGCFVGNYLYSQGIFEINLSVVVGLLAAMLFVLTYRLVSPELAFCIAFYLLVVRRGMSIPMAMIPCLALVVAALFLGRWIVTVTTAVFGAFAVVNLAPKLPLLSEMKLPFLSLLTPEHREYFFALGLLALLGFLCQFGFGSSDPLVRFKKK